MAIEAATVASTALGRKDPRQFRGLFEYVIPFEFNLDEDSIASGASSAATVVVTGAKQGDFVMVAIEADVDDLAVSAQATNTDEVVVVITDGSAGANTTLAGNPRVRGLVFGTDSGLWDNVASA